MRDGPADPSDYGPARDCCLLTDANGVIIHVTAAHCKALGHAASSLLGEYDVCILHPDDEQSLRTLEECGVDSFETTYRRRHASGAFIAVNARRVKLADGGWCVLESCEAVTPAAAAAATAAAVVRAAAPAASVIPVESSGVVAAQKEQSRQQT